MKPYRPLSTVTLDAPIPPAGLTAGTRHTLKKHNVRPTWWLLYLVNTLGLVLFGLESRMPVPEAVHVGLEIVLLLLLFGLIALWVKANGEALDRAGLK